MMARPAKPLQRIRQAAQKGLWKLGFHQVLPDRPSTLMVEPTNICNLKCPACPTGAGRLNRPPRTMIFAEFKGVIDQANDPLGYLKRVTLFNYGEPFLCQDLLRMVRYATDLGRETFTSTNGHFFQTDEAVREVVESGLTELIVCLDGADQETHGRYRQGANLAEVIAGLRRLLRVRAELGRSNPIVELQFIVMKHNQHQGEAVRQLARELGVDRFIEKTVGINPTDPDFERLAGELLPDDEFHSRFERGPGGAVRLKGEPSDLCEYVYSTLVVNSNGDVVPCCYDISSDYVMGNIFEQSLDSIWRGEKFRMFRRRLGRERASLTICVNCPEGRMLSRTEEVANDNPGA